MKKNFVLHIYNYGSNEVAKFKSEQDVFECLCLFNDRLIKTYGSLPEHIFYYVTYTLKHPGRQAVNCITVSFTPSGEHNQFTESAIDTMFQRSQFLRNRQAIQNI